MWSIGGCSVQLWFAVLSKTTFGFGPEIVIPGLPRSISALESFESHRPRTIPTLQNSRVSTNEIGCVVHNSSRVLCPVGGKDGLCAARKRSRKGNFSGWRFEKPTLFSAIDSKTPHHSILDFLPWSRHSFASCHVLLSLRRRDIQSTRAEGSICRGRPRVPK